MRNSRTVRRSTVTAFLVAAFVAAATSPAQATGGSYKSLTCTSYNGYSIAVQGKAKGAVYHALDSGSTVYVYKGTFSSEVTRTTNTGVGGTHNAWVHGFDSGAITGSVSSNSSYCTTS